ncbi:MAG: SPOR domain-containing protein [Myxococcota bacterium]
MRDARKIQERTDVRLDRTQVIWLSLGITILLGLSFALGLVAGRRAERTALAKAERDGRDTMQAVEDASSEHAELTFYRDLKEEAPPAPALTTTETRKKSRALSAPTSSTLASARNGHEKSDTERPASKSPAPTPVETVESSPKPQSESPKPAASPSTPRPVPQNSGGGREAVREKLAAGPAEDGQYTVQVSAFQDMDEAKAFAASLERKGFSPFITSASLPEKGTWYRVRMGAFENEFQATVAKQLLAKDDIPGWVLKAR